MKLIYAYSQELKDPTLEFPQEDVNLFKEIYKIDGDGWLVDRTGLITFPFNETLLDRHILPECVEPVTFADACLFHANELLDLDQPIYIMWSGGIDSTATVVSLLRTGRPLDRVKIILNYDSVKEYKNFYETYIRGKFKILPSEQATLLLTFSKLDGIVYSGEGGDQIMGNPLATVIYRTMPQGFLERPFNLENLRELFSFKGISEKSIRCWFDMYITTITRSPRPIKNMYDLVWWHGFNFKWQQRGLVIYLRIHKDAKVEPFYCGKKFQEWSCTNEPNLENFSTLKSEQKKFIADFTGDNDYFVNKLKHPSSTLYYGIKSASALDENFNKLFDCPLMNFYNPNNSFSKWLTTNC